MAFKPNKSRKELHFLLWSALLLGLCSGFSPSSFNIRERQLQIENQGQTRLFSASSDDDDSFMASLRDRMTQVTDRDTKLPLVVLDSMLPRQVMKIKVNNDLFINLIKSRLEEETPCIGILGIAKLSTGEQVHLTNGVEVQIMGKPVMDETNGGVLLELKAGRRFSLQGEIDTATQGWTEGRVQFL